MPGVTLAPVRNIDNDLVAVIQKDVANLSLPDPMLLQTYSDYSNRILWIDFDIDNSVLEYVKKIMGWNRSDTDIPVTERHPIWILIHSNGGNVYPSIALIDTILASKTPVYTVNMGIAMSAAFEILICGKKRFCLQHSTAMYHSGSGGYEGTYEQSEQAMAHYRSLVSKMERHVLDMTEIKNAAFKKNKSKDWYMDADEQLSSGVVDRIIESLDEIM